MMLVTDNKTAYVMYADVNEVDLNKASLLPDFRRKKFESFVFEKDKRLSLGAWLLVMKGLGAAASKNILYTQYNKPFVPGSKLQFNVSHSGHYATCVFAKFDVGCDIEKIRPYDDKLAKFCMQDEEIALIEKNAKRFYTFWTLKESYMKATAQGLNLVPTSFSVGNAWINLENNVQILEQNSEQVNLHSYSFKTYNIDDKYCAAVCGKISSFNIFLEKVDF